MERPIRLLLVGKFENGALASSYSHAFKENGCQVIEFDYEKEYKAANFLAGNRYFSAMLRSHFYRKLNEKLLTMAQCIKPDLLFAVKSPFLTAATLQQIRETTGTLLFQFNPDNPFNTNRGASNHEIRQAIPAYDCYFIWGKFLISQLKQAGAKRVEYLPFAWDPTLHHPVQCSLEEQRMYGSDVAFIGTWEQEREKWLEKIADFDLAIWGNLWDRVSRNSPLQSKWRQRRANPKEFCEICRCSKIILNFVRKQNGNAHNMRTFEVPGCQGFLLSTQTDEQLDLFEKEKETDYFQSVEELRSKISKYLQDDAHRQMMRHKAHRKVQPHTYFERSNRILELYGTLKASR